MKIMIKINKSLSLTLLFSYLFCLYYPGELLAQIQRNSSTGRNNQSNPQSNTQNQSNHSSQSNNSGNPSQPQPGNAGNQGSGSSNQSNSIKAYDPFLDNHLKAPPAGINVGKLFFLKLGINVSSAASKS